MRAFTQEQNQSKEQALNGSAKQSIKTSAVNEVLQSAGQSLDASTREFMESRFNHDFSGVRVHTDSKAAESAASVNALAYTVGRNVVFGAGKYRPDTTAGKQLLAHELAHTIQQSNGLQTKLAINEPGDRYEQEAERASRAISGGESFPVYGHTGAGIMRQLNKQQADKTKKDDEEEDSNLQSDLLKGCPELEQAYDGKLLIRPGAQGDGVARIQKAINTIYKGKKDFKPLEVNGRFDEATTSAVSRFQTDYALKRGTNAIVGFETIGKLDSLLNASKAATLDYLLSPLSGMKNFSAEKISTDVKTNINRDQHKINAHRIAKALLEKKAYERQGRAAGAMNTTFLESVLNMSDADMSVLNPAQRLNFMMLILGFAHVGGDAETALIALLRSTPKPEIPKMFGALQANGGKLLKQLESKMHGDNYDQYHSLLREMMFRKNTLQQTKEKMESLQKGDSKNTLPWADPNLLKSYFSTKVVYDVELTKEGKVKVSWTALKYTQVIGVQTPVEFKPDEMVRLKLLMDESHLGKIEGAEGKTYEMPAINLLNMSNKQFNQTVFDALEVASLAVGIGELTYGLKGARLLLAVADVLYSASGMVIDSFRSDIDNSESGQKFLYWWDIADKLKTIYGLTKLVTDAPETISSLKESWKNFEPTAKSKIPQKQIDNIAKTIEKLDEARQQAQIEKVKKASKPKPYSNKYGGGEKSSYRRYVSQSKGKKPKQKYTSRAELNRITKSTKAKQATGGSKTQSEKPVTPGVKPEVKPIEKSVTPETKPFGKVGEIIEKLDFAKDVNDLFDESEDESDKEENP